MADESGSLVSWTVLGTSHLDEQVYTEDKPVLIDAEDPSRYVSRGKAAKLMHMLVAAFEKHSTICLHLPNDVLYPVLMLAIWACHCRWTGSNLAYTKFELHHHLDISKAKYIITPADQVPAVRSALDDLDVEIIVFTDILQEVCDDAWRVKGLRTLHDLLIVPSKSEMDPEFLAGIKVDDVAALQSTSGTTGPFKVAERTHKSFMLESAAIEDDSSTKDYEARRLFCTPIFHAFSLPVMAINSLRFDHPTYIMKKFDDTFAQKVHDFQITEAAAPPPILMKLHQQSESHSLLQSLRVIYTGGAPLAPELRQRVLQIFKVAPRIVQVWGMTEGGWFSTFRHPEDDTTGSVGRPLSGVEIVVDPKSVVETTGEKTAGELLVRSKQLMNGYFGNKQATKDAFDGQWLRTGDLGYVEEGKVYLVDRLKDMIKVNAWQVAPAELEGALLQMAGVTDAAAISAGSGVDEHPMVFVVCPIQSLGREATLSAIKNHMRSRLASYKVIKIDVHLIDAIPRNPSGKILRKKLKELAVKEGWIRRSVGDEPR